MALFLLLGMVGIIENANSVPLLFLQFLALVGAGYVSGRLAGFRRVFHGGLAALVVFGLTSLIALAVVGGGTSFLALLFSGVVAAVLGSAGGALAEWSAQT